MGMNDSTLAPAPAPSRAFIMRYASNAGVQHMRLDASEWSLSDLTIVSDVFGREGILIAEIVNDAPVWQHPDYLDWK